MSAPADPSLTLRLSLLEERWRGAPGSRWFVPLTDLLLRMEQAAQAIQVCRQGLEEHRDSASGYLLMARGLVRLGRVEEARLTFLRVLELDPQNRMALEALGRLALEAGEREMAVSWYRRLQEVDPDPELAGVLDRVESPGGGPETSVPPGVILTATLGDIYAQQGLYEKALEIYRLLLARSPEQAELKAKIAEVERQWEEERARWGNGRLKGGEAGS